MKCYENEALLIVTQIFLKNIYGEIDSRQDEN